MTTFSQRHARPFTRATIASLLATGTEFVVLGLLAHLSRVPYWVSFGLVQFLGTLLTFTLNKYWAFEAKDGPTRVQALRSLVVFAGSFVLNTALPSVGAYLLHGEPVLSFAVSQGLVYLLWNYPLNRFWVFEKRD